MSNIIIDVAAEFTGKKAFDKAGKSTANLEKSVKRLGRSLGIALSTTAVVNFGKASVKAFAADDAAAKSLGQTLKNLGLAYGANIGTVNGFISRLEAQTGVLDDELRPAMDRLLRATGDVTKSQELLGLALDIAAGTGKSVTQVSQSLQKAYLGQTQALGRLGVGLSKAELASLSFEEIQARLTYLFSGQAIVAADSYQGSINKLSVAANNAKETIGKGLIDAVSQLSGKKGVGGAVTAIDKLAEGISSAVVGIGYLVDKVKFAWPILVAAGVAVTAAWMPWFTAIAAAVAALSWLGNKLKGAAGFQGMGNVAMTGGSNMDTQKADLAAKKSAAAKIAADKKAATAKIALDKKAAENALKLKKAESIVDLDKIQIEAALKGKISADEKLRLELQRAILNEDFTLAEKLQKQLEASQRATGALQGQLNAIKPATDPFAEWIKSLEEISKTLTKILGTPINMTSSSMVNPNQKIVATQTPNSPFQPTPDPIQVVVEPSPVPATNNSLAGLGGNTGGFGFSLPSYLKDTILQSQSAVTVNVTNTGSVIMQDDFVTAVGEALIIGNTNGQNNYRPGAIVTDG